MVSKKMFLGLTFLSLVVAQDFFGGDDQDDNNQNDGNGNDQNGGQAVLDPDVIQEGSFQDGTDAGSAEEGEAPSATSNENFINFCQGETLMNGLQIVEGSCNGIVQGKIPSKDQMISSLIIEPAQGDEVPAGQDFQIQVQTQNLIAGSFTNADTTYYSAPQDLQDGLIVGHTHVTVQDLGSSFNPGVPPDPTQFVFFKGINDAGDGNGLLAADVEGGLPAGFYRVCTLTSSSNHAPVIMPVAQRGAQDDCTKFQVVGEGGEDNDAANDGEGGLAAAESAQQAVDDFNQSDFSGQRRRAIRPGRGQAKLPIP
ncbi:hypothetical protein F4780DRAFT_691402 [Xylariomycetidae sp. FL0641]|nr:hypothetical protein F4780DRAFT_691402 [Xylariomycetidae sp. FL0641]